MIINTDLSLHEIKNNVNRTFQKAAVDSRHNLRFFTIATYDEVSNTPQNRMVVLRKFLPDWTFRFYTDYRSSKVTQIKNHSSISLLFWNPEQKYQIRVQASATVHYQNEICSKELKSVKGIAQEEYMTSLAPGTKMSSPGEVQQTKNNTHYFSVVDMLPHQIKILQLNRSGHLAIRFNRESAAHKWNGTWIAP